MTPYPIPNVNFRLSTLNIGDILYIFDYEQYELETIHLTNMTSNLTHNVATVYEITRELRLPMSHASDHCKRVSGYILSQYIKDGRRFLTTHNHIYDHLSDEEKFHHKLSAPSNHDFAFSYFTDVKRIYHNNKNPT